MIEIDTLFQTKTAKKKHTLWHGAYLFIAYIRDYPPGVKNALQFMSLAAYASETNNNIPTNTKWLSYELDQGIRWSF